MVLLTVPLESVSASLDSGEQTVTRSNVQMTVVVKEPASLMVSALVRQDLRVQTALVWHQKVCVITVPVTLVMETAFARKVTMVIFANVPNVKMTALAMAHASATENAFAMPVGLALQIAQWKLR